MAAKTTISATPTIAAIPVPRNLFISIFILFFMLLVILVEANGSPDDQTRDDKRADQREKATHNVQLQRQMQDCWKASPCSFLSLLLRTVGRADTLNSRHADSIRILSTIAMLRRDGTDEMQCEASSASSLSRLS